MKIISDSFCAIQIDADSELVCRHDPSGPDAISLVNESDAGSSIAVTSVMTRVNLAAPPCRVWDRLIFYEDIEKKPSLLLRSLLPIPISAGGRASKGGDLVKCRYVEGHLIKRLTTVAQPNTYAFSVVEQTLPVGRGIKLLGGSYSLRELPRARTELILETRYTSPHRPRWLWKRLEATTCRFFHRSLVTAIRRKLS